MKTSVENKVAVLCRGLVFVAVFGTLAWLSVGVTPPAVARVDCMACLAQCGEKYDDCIKGQGGSACVARRASCRSRCENYACGW